MSGYEKSLKQLEDALARRHQPLGAGKQVQQLASEDGAQLPMSSLHNAIGSARQDLRHRALEIGAKVYAEQPREFTRQIKRLWKAW